MIKKIKCIFAILLISCFLSASLASADNNSDKAKNSVKRIKAELKYLKKVAKDAKIRAVLAQYAATGSGFSDSDSDGVPDVIENAIGSNSCDSDSDDDGVSDDDERHSGSSPSDSTSAEVELKGLISSITETTVAVDGKLFTVGVDTQFKDGKTLASFSIGDKVEISGRVIAGVLTLRKIKSED